MKYMYQKIITDDYEYLKWETDNPKALLVINHGMAETPYRYDNFAQFLNENGYEVYAIFAKGHEEGKQLGHLDKGDYNLSIENTHKLINILRSRYDNKVILFGHSMGSFMANRYAQLYGYTLDGLVLSGSSYPGLLEKIGAVLVNLIYALSLHKNKNSKFCKKLTFGSYNKHIKNPKTEFDWLSKDANEVKKYIDSPLSGFDCTIGFYKEFIPNMAKLNRFLNDIPKTLPILLVSGSEDPVSNNGEKIRTLLVNLKDKQKIERVEIKLFDDMRHEILNEVDKSLVYQEILDFLNSIQ
ncbi:MAG: lysophospholipase [Bacillales bacterium]|jgi:alpha-beta hydrolase superfamily lysophospholipase|nr:lysophospholipase [Bacillales bacterium]